MNIKHFEGNYEALNGDNVIIAHHVDNDGFGAARVTYSVCAQPILVRANYSMPGGIYGTVYNAITDYIETHDGRKPIVFMVDLSLTDVEEYENLVHLTEELYWIDHHASSVKAIEGTKWVDDPHVYIDNHASAAILCWEFFEEFFKLHCGRYDIPDVIKLISDHDTFAHKDPNSVPFFIASAEYHLDDIPSDTWTHLMDEDDPDDLLHKILYKGIILNSYNQTIYENINKCGFDVTIIIIPDNKELSVKTLTARVVNSSFGNSFIFGDDINKYDVCVKYYQVDPHKWTYTFYSNGDVDCSEICAINNGGGHPGAAGMVYNKDIFAAGDDSMIKNTIFDMSAGTLILRN